MLARAGPAHYAALGERASARPFATAAIQRPARSSVFVFALVARARLRQIFVSQPSGWERDFCENCGPAWRAASPYVAQSGRRACAFECAPAKWAEAGKSAAAAAASRATAAAAVAPLTNAPLQSPGSSLKRKITTRRFGPTTAQTNTTLGAGPSNGTEWGVAGHWAARNPLEWGGLGASWEF